MGPIVLITRLRPEGLAVGLIHREVAGAADCDVAHSEIVAGLVHKAVIIGAAAIEQVDCPLHLIAVAGREGKVGIGEANRWRVAHRAGGRRFRHARVARERLLPQIPLLLEHVVEGEERDALAVGGGSVDRRVAKRATVQL